MSDYENGRSPDQFYFSVGSLPEVVFPVILVVYKETWDNYRRWDDSCENSALEQMDDLGYIDITECMYEAPCDDTAIVREALSNAGFIENDDIWI